MIKNYFGMEVCFRYTPLPGMEQEPVGDFMDGVVEHLEELGVKDVNVVLDKRAMSFVVSLTVEATEGESVETTIGKGLGSLRTALHYCGAHTPAWPLAKDLVFGGISLSPVPDRELVGL